MVESLCFATFMTLFIVGLIITVMRVSRLFTRYRSWTNSKKYPALWVEVPLLILAWTLMFLLGWSIFS